jgi:hypothetical protein
MIQADGKPSGRDRMAVLTDHSLAHALEFENNTVYIFITKPERRIGSADGT